MRAYSTIPQLVAARSAAAPQAVALEAPGREPLTYADLDRELRRVATELRALGLEPGHRVGIVVPNGPEMAVAFLAVSSVAVSAPLNPGYRAPELDFYLSDLGARALVVAEGLDTPARAVAESRGVPVVELRAEGDAPAGTFHLRVPEGSGATGENARDAAPDDVALVLHTSGTTSRPKMVPLTHTNLCRSAASIAATLGLEPGDRCLNVMPLFHIHGLVAAVLASLTAGARVVCTPGFLAPEFLGWVRDHRATWYTAVPTMHQAILARAGDSAARPETDLRFVRSSSSSLPPQVARDLERVFGVPAIEAYGMTEAAHQMCSNPLPPGANKHGSVGPPAGPEVALMDADGKLLPPDATGEVVIRGPNVTRGYENDDGANARAFVDGWFRTGDEGRFDEDGYLVLTGRLKEMIDRGGENVSPREIDEVLLEHPDVLQAVAFAMPDARLGEEVAAAVVLRPGAGANEERLQAFVAQRLADFKVPRRIVVLDEIPKGPTGKLQRIGLAERLGLTGEAPETGTDSASGVAPRTDVERGLLVIWEDVLDRPGLGIRTRFLDAGGDSILAMRITARVLERWGVELPMLAFFQTPTIEEMARIVEGKTGAGGGADDADLAGLLDELEGMSEEDADRELGPP